VTSRDVRGFLHVCCRGAYREVTWEIVHTLLESGIYDRSVAIELGVLGDDAQQRVVETLIRPFERFRIAFRSSDIEEYEFPTLDLLQHACQTWTGPVYYLHTKGATRSPYDQYARYWRQLMLDEVVTNHKRCLAELTDADTVGTNWRGNHYSGNFWWARASHIRHLPDIRGLQRFPRPIAADAVWNKRLQCEFWLTMAQGRFACVGYSGLDLYQDLRWTTSVADIINDLVAAGAGLHFVELSIDGPSPYFDAVEAISKVSVSYRSDTDALSEEDFLAADPPDGGYDVVFVDTWHEPTHCLDVIERCLPKLSADGVLVVHDSNPPSAWHQRPAEEYEPGSAWNGQVWRAVVEFRARHPGCEVFTVDTDWGCTVIRPSRRACEEPAAESVDLLDWTALEHDRRRLLNVVDVAWFRRHLYADPYLVGRAQLVSRTEVLNVLVSIYGLDSYLEIGVADGETLAQVIAPIRQSVDPYTDAATYRMTSDNFFASGLGLDRYDLIFIDGLHEEDQCRRDLEHALARLSDRGWIVAHDANPPTEWHQRPVEHVEPGSEWNGTVWKALIRFRSEHPELELCTLDVDWGCALLRRCAGDKLSDPGPGLPDIEQWAFFAEHRRELLNLVPPSAEELRNLLC
jgi:predicted O-methyltransferase YrrM